jgi:antitoxin component of RelBE/YafQ-DinJ toxin-antitoxin module
MTSQVIFTVDSKLKQRAMRRAKARGIPFASVLKMATQAFVEGSLDVRLDEVDPPLNAASRKRLERIIADIEAGKNLSPAFTNVQDVMAYLQKP